MSKTLAEIAHHSWQDRLGCDQNRWEQLDEYIQLAWQAAANVIIEECAKVADELHWTLPFYADPQANELTDNTAEEIRSQVTAAIRALKSPETDAGEATP